MLFFLIRIACIYNGTNKFLFDNFYVTFSFKISIFSVKKMCIFDLFFKIGTKRVLDLAKQMKRLVCFMHLSTAFCHVDQEELGECIFDPPHDPHEIMKLVQWMDEETLDLITPK